LSITQLHIQVQQNSLEVKFAYFVLKNYFLQYASAHLSHQVQPSTKANIHEDTHAYCHLNA